MNRSLVWLVLWLVGSLARVSAADVDVVIPAGDGTFTTNIVFTTAELGATKTVGVTPAKDYHFKSQPTVNHDSTVIMVQQVSYSECGAEYKIWLVGNHKQGTVQISGTITPGGCSSGSGGGGGGRGGGTSTPPSDRGFEINVLQRQTVIYFTEPANGTNLTASVGSTNNLAVRVVLGDATAPASGTVTFSRSPSDLGTLDPSSVALNAGVASTTFIAATTGGNGTITASATGLRDAAGNTLPNISTNLTVAAVSITSQTVRRPFGLDPSRTTIGVGEAVELTLAPAQTGTITWTVAGGGTLDTSGNPVILTAPPTGTPACTVSANIGAGCVVKKTFVVLEPTGASGSAIRTTDPTVYFPGGYPTGGVWSAGAFMQVDVWIAPTNVCFSKVFLREENGPPANVTGDYFVAMTNNTPNSLNHFADSQYRPVNTENYLGHDSCGTRPLWWIGPWGQGGSFQWAIPVSWYVPGGPTNTINVGWTQYFTLDANGTVSVRKFNSTVTRGTNGVVSTSNQ